MTPNMNMKKNIEKGGMICQDWIELDPWAPVR